MVVNKKHCFNPIDFVPRDLTGFQGFLVSAKIVPDPAAMFNAAATAGVQLNMTSSYRLARQSSGDIQQLGFGSTVALRQPTMVSAHSGV